jgi:hypothetical protein
VRAKGASNPNYSKQLLKAIGKVDGLVTSDEDAWRSRLSLIVRENNSSNSGSCTTRSIISLISEASSRDSLWLASFLLPEVEVCPHSVIQWLQYKQKLSL